MGALGLRPIFVMGRKDVHASWSSRFVRVSFWLPQICCKELVEEMDWVAFLEEEICEKKTYEA